MKRLVPHNEQEERDHEAMRRYQEFVSSLVKLLPFVPWNLQQRLISSTQMRERFEEVAEAFFLIGAAGFDPSERGKSLDNLLAAYWGGWKIELYRPRMLRIDSTFLPDLEKFFGYQVKVLRKNPVHFSLVREGEVQRLIYRRSLLDVRKGTNLFWSAISKGTQHILVYPPSVFGLVSRCGLRRGKNPFGGSTR